MLYGAVVKRRPISSVGLHNCRDIKNRPHLNNAGAALYLISDTYVNSCVWSHTVRTACQHTILSLNVVPMWTKCVTKDVSKRWDDRRSLRCSDFVKLTPKGGQPVSLQSVVTTKGARMRHTPSMPVDISLGFDSEVGCRFVHYINDTI